MDQFWSTPAFGAIIAVAGTLGAVYVTSWTQRAARRESRRDARSDELRAEAAEILGATRVVLAAMAPNPGVFDETEIKKRRIESDALRPRIEALAVKWTEASDDLVLVSDYMRWFPTKAYTIVDLVRGGKNTDSLQDRHVAEHREAESALKRTVERVPQVELSSD